MTKYVTCNNPIGQNLYSLQGINCIFDYYNSTSVIVRDKVDGVCNDSDGNSKSS